MEKKYDKRVIQYSLEGKELNIFSNAANAGKIVNYDSIIHCCKGNYKTAGGFIWRFEGDDFSIESTRDKNLTIKCGICGSDESIRSMAMHLKWVHNIKTEDYVEQYGEFRPKQLKALVKLDESEFKCEICGKKVKSYRELSFHLHEHPETNWKEYCLKHNIVLAEKIEPPEFKACSKCGEIKPITEFCKKKGEKDGYHRYCKECSYKISEVHYHYARKINKKEYYQEYRDSHKDYMIEYNQKYYFENKEYRKEWEFNRLRTDVGFRLKKVTGANIYGALRRYHQTKKDRTVNYLGIPISEYVTYLESQFTPEMSWDNYASYWEIDHIMPIDSYDLTDEKQVYECFNYKNTRPLYWRENVTKGNKILPEFRVEKDEE